MVALRTLEKGEFVDFFDEYIKIGAPNKKSLSICIYGKGMAVDKDKVSSPCIDIEDIVSFKKKKQLARKRNSEHIG